MELNAAAISIGIINITTGNTKYKWSIYDSPKESTVFLTNRGSLLIASSSTFKKGDIVTLRDNDSNRLLVSRVVIKDFAPAIKDEVLLMLKNNNYDYYPIASFKARPKGNRKLGTSYSIKGTTEA